MLDFLGRPIVITESLQESEFRRYDDISRGWSDLF